MKKIFIVFVVLFAVAGNLPALNPASYDVFCRLNEVSTFSGLVKYLNADAEQAENLKNIIDLSNDKLKKALVAGNEIAAEEAMNINLGNAKRILTSLQYKKYLTIIELTISNTSKDVLLAGE
ncbi:MAG TPA: hypothetical protein VK152_11805 [Paludibacter sp.]|nr:hypothetical protein [Paludibacter sp.]